MTKLSDTDPHAWPNALVSRDPILEGAGGLGSAAPHVAL